MSQFHAGCHLSYMVSGPTAFIFNVSVVNNAFQSILAEDLRSEPAVAMEELVSPVEEKLHHRFSADTGPSRVCYSATVELSHHVQAACDVSETPPEALPVNVVPYLYPSRYCESDMLVRLAMQPIGGSVPKVYCRSNIDLDW